MQVRVRVSRDFLELVEKNVLSSHPAWRGNASSIDNTVDATLLIPDHSLLWNSCNTILSLLLFDIRLIPNTFLHTFQISKTSEYNPLDLFSESKERIRTAIKSFFSTPQNNFRIFVNGSLAFGGMGGGADSVHPADTDKCIEYLSKVSGLELPDFTKLCQRQFLDLGY
jgi:inositol-pentakisphosphate 2-kinase